MLTGKEPSEDDARCLDVSLILYAEHGFNASTFTARTCASTLSDLHSCITGAIGTGSTSSQSTVSQSTTVHQKSKKIDEHLKIAG